LLTNCHSIQQLFHLKKLPQSFPHTLYTPSAAKSTTSNDTSVRKPFSSNFIFPVIPFASNLNRKKIKRKELFFFYTFFRKRDNAEPCLHGFCASHVNGVILNGCCSINLSNARAKK